MLSASYPVNKLENSLLRSQWVKNLTEKAIAYHADGVNIDIEEPVKEKSKEMSLLTKLANETAVAFHTKIPGSQVRQRLRSEHLKLNRYYNYISPRS